MLAFNRFFHFLQVNTARGKFFLEATLDVEDVGDNKKVTDEVPSHTCILINNFALHVDLYIRQLFITLVQVQEPRDLRVEEDNSAGTAVAVH